MNPSQAAGPPPCGTVGLPRTPESGGSLSGQRGPADLVLAKDPLGAWGAGSQTCPEWQRHGPPPRLCSRWSAGGLAALPPPPGLGNPSTPTPGAGPQPAGGGLPGEGRSPLAAVLPPVPTPTEGRGPAQGVPGQGCRGGGSFSSGPARPSAADQGRREPAGAATVKGFSRCAGVSRCSPPSRTRGCVSSSPSQLPQDALVWAQHLGARHAGLGWGLAPCRRGSARGRQVRRARELSPLGRDGVLGSAGGRRRLLSTALLSLRGPGGPLARTPGALLCPVDNHPTPGSPGALEPRGGDSGTRARTAACQGGHTGMAPKGPGPAPTRISGGVAGCHVLPRGLSR